MNTHDMTCHGFLRWDSLKQIRGNVKFLFRSPLNLCQVSYCHLTQISLLLQVCIYCNTGVCRTSKTKNNCQILASSFQLFHISAEAAMQRIWFPSELFLSLCEEKLHTSVTAQCFIYCFVSFSKQSAEPLIISVPNVLSLGCLFSYC